MTNAYDIYPEFNPNYDPLGIHPHTIPATDIFQEPVVNVAVNAEWASHITGMIERLIYLDAWEGTEAEKYAAIDKVIKIISEFDKSENQGEKWIMQQYARSYTHFHLNSKVESGNPIGGIANASQEFGWSWRQNAAAQNDKWYFEVLLPVDTFDFDLCHFRQSGGGILTLSLNGESPFATIDLYAATTIPAVHSTGFFTTTVAGKQQIEGKLATKNASSSGYVANITYLAIRPHYGTG